MNYSQRNIEALYSLISSLFVENKLDNAFFSVIKTPKSIWPNVIYDLSCSEDELDTVLSSIEDNPNLPSILMMNPIKHSEGFVDAIDKLGYKKGGWYAMSMSLNKKIIIDEVDGFNIIKVENGEQLNDWLTIVEKELMREKRLNKSAFENLLLHETTTFYLGEYNGKPVSTCFTFVKNSEVGVYLVATDSNFRKRGFGKLITQYSIKEAREKNCQLAILQATEIGKGIYESIGFKNEGKIYVYNLRG